MSGSRLRAHRSQGTNPTITAYPDDRAEAEGVAAAVRDAYSVAGSWSDQAVLVRTNAQLLLIDQALSEAGAPTRIRGGAGPLAAPEVRAELKALGRPGTDLQRAIADLGDRVRQSAQDRSPADADRRANLDALARLITDYLSIDPRPTGPGLVAWIKTLQAGDLATGGDAVELATFHGSKGLEWPVVHVAGLEDGFVPIAYASTGAQLGEERRLLYVALTRAKDELHLSWAAERTFAAKAVKRQPSPHLELLSAALARLGVSPAQRVDWRAGLARSRLRWAEATGAVGSPPPTGEPLGEALRRWRHRKALAASVPDHAVLSDQALRSIASGRPATRAALASMPGLGPAKLQRYGDELLRVVAACTDPPVRAG
jgi:DNA helicase-2/ATP-dependent DNA helicase PcrA